MNTNIVGVLGGLVLLVFVVIVIMTLAMPTVSSATQFLEDRGYVVISSTGAVGTLTPSIDKGYDLGSLTKWWRDLFVRDIYIADVNTWIARDAGGNLQLTDNVIGTKTLTQLASSGTANITGVGTSGYIPVWDTGSALTNSVVTANIAGISVDGQTSSDMLQIGTATPIFPLYAGSAFMSQLQIDGTAILKSADWGVSQLNYGDSATIPEHTGTGSYDYTGGAYERLFTATAPIFAITDAQGNMIILLSGAHVGSVVEIEIFLSATQVVVAADNGWNADVTGETFGILPTPTFGIANSGSARFAMGGDATLKMRSLNATSPAAVNVQVIDGGNDVSAFQVDVLNQGYKHNEAIDVNYSTGSMVADQHASIVKISVDKSEATSSTNTTELDFINIQQVGKNSSQSHAVHVGQGFDTALIVSGGSRVDPAFGYTVTAAHAVTDRIAAFISAASDVTLFALDDNYILLGNTTQFEAIPVYLSTMSSQSITPTFYYSTGDGTWDTLVVSDTTGGFTGNGIISFNAPVAWATTTHVVPAGAAITSGYYVKIVRTRNTLTTPPIESYFKLYTSSSLTDFMIRGNGTISLVSMSDTSAPNNSVYYSTTQSKMVFKDLAGVVKDLY